jgi:hypothetical protein
VKRFGIIIKHADGTRRLFGTVSRTDQGDVYANWIVVDSSVTPGMKPWNPHASYHASGQRHAKSHNRILNKKELQPPGSDFVGTELIENINANRGLSERLPTVSEAFDDTFEIDVALISGTTSQVVGVDLIAPGATPFVVFNEQDTLVASKVFRDQVPWISVRLVEPSRDFSSV